MKAIDLYSGVGGWSLGLRMSGIDVLASYEWWPEATRTYAINFSRQAIRADIRQLPLSDFPTGVDIVVGSPPCTQFSFANRGGNGNIADGLTDIAKFLAVVEHVEPRYWVMENVPRVAAILEREIGLGGSLRRYEPLVRDIIVVNTSDFGLPQRRRRMLAGDFPAELLVAYRGKERAATLGEVLAGLNADPVVDPVFGIRLAGDDLTDHIPETPLSGEESRLNREMKEQHPFYNVMSFPDPPDRVARTVTALCTRVSRESIVIADGTGQLRRLTLRERATLQGFPITFQFAGSTYSDKLKQVGNAIPPVLTFYVGQSLRGIPAARAQLPRDVRRQHRLPRERPPELPPAVPGQRYAANRRFRAVIPGFRFGSGVRFELSNFFHDDGPDWRVAFYFGTSREILSVDLNGNLVEALLDACHSKGFRTAATVVVEKLQARFEGGDAAALQSAWLHRIDGLHPFGVVDALASAGDELFGSIPPELRPRLEDFVLQHLEESAGRSLRAVETQKLRRFASRIGVGWFVGAWFNDHPAFHGGQVLAAAG